MSLELDDIASGFSSAKVNANFEKVENWINLNALWRQGTEAGQANQMETNLDMNGFAILNAAYDPDEPDSFITLAGADARYLNVTGDAMEGPLTVLPPTDDTNPVRKDGFDAERVARIAREDEIDSGYKTADASLQAQLSGTAPLEASAFSPISWHDQVIDNSVTVPENKNAWSFGPSMTVLGNSEVIVPASSSWIVAEGRNDNLISGSIFSEVVSDGDQIVLNTHPAYTNVSGYVDGMVVRFRASTSNTGATTVNLDSIGDVSVVTPTGVALPEGFIRTDVETTLTYDFSQNVFVASRKPEFITNENGVAVRFENGWAECLSEIVPNIDIQNVSGSIYRSEELTIDYPITFAATPRGWGTTHNTNFAWASGRAINNTQGRIILWATVSRTGDSGKIMANGYWYI